MATLAEIVQYAQQLSASDVHVSVGTRPTIRVDSTLTESVFERITPEAMDGYVAEIIPKSRLEDFHRDRELDFSIGRADTGRLRVNAYYQRSTVALSLRLLPQRILTFEEIGLPSGLMKRLVESATGLVLLTGPTGSGKTTTLAAIVDAIASSRECHIVTIEDPIEYVYQNAKATIHQREVGSDTLSFSRALRQVLRQDPDVIVIGEMRDEETAEAALTAAETGHLVIATVHTPDTVQTINRIIDMFQEQQHAQVRTQLSFVLNAVISQRLIPRARGGGRVLAAEILVATPAVRSLIREHKVHQLYSTLQTSGREGMRTMNQSLVELVNTKKVTEREALKTASNEEEFRKTLGHPIGLPPQPGEPRPKPRRV